MSAEERRCDTCAYAERGGSEHPCWECKRTKVINTSEYDEAPDLWRTRIPPTVKKKTEPNVLQTVMRTRKKGEKYATEPAAFALLKSKLNEGWVVVMCNPIGDELEYILQKTEVIENG